MRPVDDALVLWKYDRAFRSLRHALDALELFEAQIAEIMARLRQDPEARTRDIASAYGVSVRIMRPAMN